MLFIGYFSFDENAPEGNVRHGYVSCLVDADSPDTAAKDFKEHLLRLKTDEKAFNNIVKIYIEDIIGIETIPGSPIVTRLQSAEGPFPKSISYSLPSVRLPGIDAFGYVQDMKEAAHDVEEYQASIPFLEFD